MDMDYFSEDMKAERELFFDTFFNLTIHESMIRFLEDVVKLHKDKKNPKIAKSTQAFIHLFKQARISKDVILYPLTHHIVGAMMINEEVRLSNTMQLFLHKQAQMIKKNEADQGLQ